ncbi:lysine-specific demethylase JMJ28 [Rutidosis leptorrhynchoides]|uniref:lysine-specific demethylase JMJ28 n=1 Tax=Rutidosis leptorrhynchoides TaxID=125765 RepID=UPI003A990EF9
MVDSGGSLPNDQRCKRTDGRKWRCGRPVFEGRTLCEQHFLQGRLRQNKEPVPDNLKFERQKPLKIDENPNHNLKRGNDNSSNSSRKRPKRSKKEPKLKSSVDLSKDLDDALKKMNLKKGDLQLDLIRGSLKRQIEKKKGKEPPQKQKQQQQQQQQDIVKELKYGRLEISQCSPPSTSSSPSPPVAVKLGVSANAVSTTRSFRSKNINPAPIVTKQNLPSIKANAKASTKKCHWCRMCSYRVLVKCLTCKKNFFCEDCISQRLQEKADVKKECPVCCGSCGCKVCVKEKSKEVKTKDLIVYSYEGNFDKTQQLLYKIHLLLPFLEQINTEKDMELNIEAKFKGRGKDHNELQIQDSVGSPKKQCCGFCKGCVVDVHRSCGNCSYILCLPCCRDFRAGRLHGGLRDKRETLSKVFLNWKTNEDGSINCPPKNLGGCGDGILGLISNRPYNWTKDLGKDANEIICNSKFTKFIDYECSICALCKGNNKGENKDLYFEIKHDLGDKNLEHFTKHWVKGQPLIIRDMIKNDLELSWDPLVMFGMYLERSAKSRNERDAKSKNRSDWCEVDIGRHQIFMGGKTHANVWHEKLKFKVWLSSGIFQEHFASHYAAVMNALPLQQYINPLTGVLNLAANMPPESQNVDLGPFVYISYGRPEDLMGRDFLTKLCYHAYDMVNILVHATEDPISERKLNKVKVLLNKYSSQDDDGNENIKKIDEPCGKSSFSSEVTQQSELEDNTNGELTQIRNGDSCVFSDESSIDDSDDEEGGGSSFHKKEVVDTCGAQWDVFRREDVSKLVEFLKKYSNDINSSSCSRKKVVHPILDDNFYLDSFHKRYLKEEFGVEPWTFEQNMGEAIIVPAGCPYQVKKIKSCVNVVLECISPESASMGVKLSDEIRQLPVRHKAKGKMIDVKKMIIHSVNAAVEEINKVSQAETSVKVGD